MQTAGQAFLNFLLTPKLSGHAVFHAQEHLQRILLIGPGPAMEAAKVCGEDAS